MKTVKIVILGTILALALFSCENPVSLGAKLDLEGPILNFTSPTPRKAVTSNFILEGTAADDNSVKTLLVKVEKDRVEMPRQWRYSKGNWEISDNSGIDWRPLEGGVWEGDKSVKWSVPIEMLFNGQKPQDGEYMFIAQAWDKGGVTDDNSYKTLIIIVDNDPPKVTVLSPMLFSRYITYNPTTGVFDDKELEELRSLSDWRNPEFIGKFQTNFFTLQWNIEDNFNIWSFDLRFYEMSVPIDDNYATPLPDDYVYRYHKNLPPAPPAPSPDDYLKPNGSVTIPALDAAPGFYGEDSELKKQIKDKTVIRIVAVCYDSANNAAQEKTIGYFVYWPQADIPWITYSGDLYPPEYYIDHPASSGPFSSNVEEAFLVYPGRDVKAIAFHAQGIREVTFSLYKLEPAYTLGASEETLLAEYVDIKKENPLRGNNTYSTSFSWDFRPPPRSAFYVVKAKTLSVSGKWSELSKVVFKVQDISFPDFPKSVQPPALEPLFKHISEDSITINGIVSDATAIDSLCLVWINPQSIKYAAQVQLEYFRESGYDGWIDALSLTPGGDYSEEAYYEIENKAPEIHPNKIWRLAPTLNTEYPNDENGVNPETQRVEYDFSITIPLDDLNIGLEKQVLKSQVFLLRAANPDNRVTIITYTPQGDETPPVIKITGVEITKTDDTKIPLTPGEFGQISKFKAGDKITISGTWREDSVKYLPFNDYLKSKFKVSINQISFPASKFSFTGTANSDTGTWTIEVVVETDIQLINLKDTLVVAANLSDFGGNKSDDGASWLIESDTLRLVRISSELADQTYNAGKVIDIFIEFNKPVRLKNGGNPSLNLNITGGTTRTARYKDGQNNLNTKQYFTYTVQSRQNTSGDWLDVTGLDGLADGTYWTADNYPFAWEAVSGTGSEEIRVTMEPSHNDDYLLSEGVLLRRLPVAANSSDSMYTLAKGKNIGIDTTAPTVTGVGSANKAGHYASGAEIDVNIIFSEAVMFKNEANPPQLILNIKNGGAGTVTTSGTPRVNNNTVTFSYTVKPNDTTEDNKVIIASFTGGGITDIAGNDMSVYAFNASNGAVNGGAANNGAGIYVNTVAPESPTFKALSANNNASVISNNLGTANSAAAGVKTLQNVYNDNLYFAVEPNGATGGINHRVGYLEYSLDDGKNWKRITNTNGTDNISGTPFQQDIKGEYKVITRQTDKAGNISPSSPAVSLTWDPGALVTRIDSASANGTYTKNSSRDDKINITVYFRKSLRFIGVQTITLNAIRGTGADRVTVSTGAAGVTSTTDQLSFTYTVEDNDNTPAGANLDVYAFATNALDQQGVNVNSLIVKPAGNEDNLNYRKEILVVTGALAGSAPVYYFPTTSEDEAAGTITITFNRGISKRTGEVTVTQQTAGYRLPAVLTETQANRYKSISGFNDCYSRGTNGFVGGAVDTTTKYVLNYEYTAVVTPGSSGIAKLAADFLEAEKVTLPISSQDITVTTDNKLVINLTGSNALQVLGATYDIKIPAGLVQDSLGFQWPASDTPYSYTTPGINRPFVRVDKKVNEDRITNTNAGSMTMPHLRSDFSRVLQTRARLDCRTPNSIVRYAASGVEHTANGADSMGNRTSNDAPNNAAGNWKNGGNADTISYLSEQTLDATGNTGSNYTDFDNHITVGSNNEQGYVWRISVRSRNGANGSNNSDLYEEIAFRTVLTYELAGIKTDGSSSQQILSSGDQLWIRGGDAVGLSSIPGFPINWQDDYGKLKAEEKRAGVRLLRMVSSNGTSFNTASVWRWITWEINVKTWHDVVLARGTDTATKQDANDAWQYGPRQWAYQRDGWSADKDDYVLNPGRHRWVRITEYRYPTAFVNFSGQFSIRGAQASTSLNQPTP